jgi:hypothetical protein
VFDEQVTVATLNTRGVAVVGTHLAGRFAVIGAEVEVGDADVACFQEVFTWWHLRLLARRMPSKFHDHRSAALYGHHVTLLPVETLLCPAQQRDHRRPYQQPIRLLALPEPTSQPAPPHVRLC